MSLRTSHWSQRSLSYADDWLRSPIRAQISDWLATAVAQLPGVPVIVDVGAGTGQNSAVIANRSGLIAIQVDANQAMLKRSALPSAPVYHASACSLPLGRATVDIVIMSLLLHHLAPAEQDIAMAEARRISRDGGKLLLVDQVRPAGFHDREYSQEVRRAFYRHVSLEDGETRFDSSLEHPLSPEALRTLIQSSGFEVESIELLDPIVWAGQAQAR